MKLISAKSTFLIVLLSVLSFGSLNAEVYKIVIKDRAVVADGHKFGTVGQYEKIRGLIYYEIDPSNPANKMIVDLQFAPRNSRGMVECSGDFILIKPLDSSKGNGRLLYDVNNRGNLYMLRNLNDAAGSHNPTSMDHFGNGFLMKEGYSLLWTAWNWDVVESSRLLQFDIPFASKNGETIKQISIAEIVNSHSLNAPKSMPLAWGNSRCYPSANYPDTSNDILTVRNSPEGDRVVIPNNMWKYASEEDGVLSDNPTSLYISTGIQPGKIYELVYEVENPKVVGLGLAAIRDALSFFKYEAKDKEGNANPLFIKKGKKQSIEYNYIFGVSQSGRVIAHMIYQGFHVDEKDRMAFDGARIHVAGGGKGGFNFRFAQTTHHPSDLEGNYMPSDHPPFNYLSDNDAGSLDDNDLLAVAKKLGKIPKIIVTNHALEYWTRSASLIHTSIDGKKDASVHKNVRIFMTNGAPHGTPYSRYNSVSEHSLSTINIAPVLRATQVMLDEWVSNDIMPAKSRYPRFQNNQLISASDHKKAMPEIEGMHHQGRNLQPPVCDYGPGFFDTGIMTVIPPLVTGHYPTFVPAVDKDGNGLGGIRLPELAVPLGTYQGFNPRIKEANATDYLTRFNGSFWPFALTKEERITKGDTRLSLEERYGSKEDYLKMVIAETNKLVEDRLLLKEDAVIIINNAEMLSWPPVMLDNWPFWK
ncbi:MAG: alpha/beta hydrolase domain-containing protein [Bacteroidales bacterium]|nr:alpha/beta hydrolase domain-containing protein [Bacteroidales bacterium]